MEQAFRMRKLADVKTTETSSDLTIHNAKSCRRVAPTTSSKQADDETMQQVVQEQQKARRSGDNRQDATLCPTT